MWNIQKATRVVSIKKYQYDEGISMSVALDGQLLAIVSRRSASVGVWDLDKYAVAVNFGLLSDL